MKRILASFLSFAVFSLAMLAAPQAPEPEKKVDKPEVKAPEKVYSTGFVMPTEEKRKAMHAERYQKHGYRVYAHTKNSSLPAKFSCVENGWTLKKIGDQGSCGSCYLYATIRQFIQSFIKNGYQKNDGSFLLAFQWAMDCHREFGGCSGGWGAEVADYIVKNGMPAERYVDQQTSVQITNYPTYEARANTCRDKPEFRKWQPTDWGYCSGNQGDIATPEQMKSCMMQYGSLNVAIQANGAFMNYRGGVIETLGHSIDHELTIVAWDDTMGKGGAWLFENQWDSTWGVDGRAWVGYKAYMTEQFWVATTALPPVPPVPPDPPDPPIPPIPPGPVPSGAIHHIAVRFVDGQTQTFYPIKGGTTMQEIAIMIAAANLSGPSEIRVVPSKEPLVDPFAQRWAAQEKKNALQDEINERILNQLEKLNRQLLPKEKQ